MQLTKTTSFLIELNHTELVVLHDLLEATTVDNANDTRAAEFIAELWDKICLEIELPEDHESHFGENTIDLVR